MKKIIKLSCLSLLITLSACDTKQEKPKIKNPLAGYTEAIDKAKAVEKQLLEAAEKQRKAIDEMSK